MKEQKFKFGDVVQIIGADIYNAEFIRWPATLTSFVIVDRENK